MGGSGVRRALALALAPGLGLVLLLAAGCGKEEMPKTYEVKGKVVLRNGKPFPGGEIVFTSVKDRELRGYGIIAKDGTFTLGTIGHTSRGRSQLLAGAVEGEFHVNIRPGGRGDGVTPPVGAGKAAFTLAKWTGVGLIGLYGFAGARLSGANLHIAFAQGLGVALIGAALILLKSLVH